MKQLDDIVVVDRFAPLRARLLALLADLDDDDWNRPTVAGRWSVKDVTAHLLGGDIGILSRKRDAFRPGTDVIDSYGQLVDLVNRLNAEWEAAARRMSPRVLRELLAFTSPAVEAYFASLDLHAIGEPVSWAGPDPAPVWFDVAREFTERWHHQEQIRLATGRPSLDDPYFLAPVLEAFVRALPHHYQRVEAPSGTVIRFSMTGTAGGTWFLHRIGGSWALAADTVAAPAASVEIAQDVAWRLFTKGIDRQEARRRSTIEGDAGLALPIFATTSIIG